MLPVIHIKAPNLPAGWEEAVVRLYQNGIRIPTQYDKPGDPLSIDAFLVLTVDYPFAEPRIHRAFPGGIEDLEIYRQEVVDGIHDHWIDPAAGKWSYTYSQRLNSYPLPDGSVVDQLQCVVNALAEVPFTRRTQAITWQPWTDPNDEHCPCLQRLHFRIIDDELMMTAHMRSNDAYKASFMNMYAFTEIQKSVAKRISAASGREVGIGQYIHVVDSFHIYGSYMEEFEGFLRGIGKRTWEERTYRTEDVQDIIDETRAMLLEKENA